MANFQLPGELLQVINRARRPRSGLWVSIDVQLHGDYSKARQIIAITAAEMFQPATETDRDINLRFMRLGVDYGVYAIDVRPEGVRWVQQGGNQ